MTIPPESIEAGKCYLAKSLSGPRLLKVIGVSPDGNIVYQQYAPGAGWGVATLHRDAFAASANREVPCDWTPEGDG